MSEVLGVREYARRVGVSHVAVLNAIKSGRLSKSVSRNAKGKPRIDAELADKEWGVNTDTDKNRNTDGKGGREKAQPPPGQRDMFGDGGGSAGGNGVARFKGKSVAEWRAEQLAISTANDTLDLALRQGRLAEVDKVKAEWFRLVRVTRDKLLIVADRIAGEAAAENAEAFARAAAVLREAVSKLADVLPRGAAAKAFADALDEAFKATADTARGDQKRVHALIDREIRSALSELTTDGR